jgi:hypothetical protein
VPTLTSDSLPIPGIDFKPFIANFPVKYLLISAIIGEIMKKPFLRRQMLLLRGGNDIILK